MNIEGIYTLQARPQEIRQSLLDQAVLRHAIPGLEHLESIGKDRYAVAIHIKYAALAGVYRGQITIKQDQHPFSYHVVIESDKNDPNTINGIGTIQLREHGDNTTISYKGTVTIGKRGTRLSPTVIKGAAKLLIQQFFTILADQLHTDTSIEETMGAAVITQPGGNIVILPSTSPLQNPPTVPTITQRIINALGLGGGDPIQEEIWINRTRRISIIVGFLLLVWIGTRLPRKRQ